jgi:hypothetical protein
MAGASRQRAEFGDQMRIQAEERIDAPTAEVFRFVAVEHFANHPKWDPSITEMTPTSPGAMGTGATARFVRVDGKKRIEGVLTVTEYEPDRLFAAVSRFGPFVLHQHAFCEPLPGGGTSILLTIHTRAAGPMRLLLPLLRRRFRKTMAASLRTIKHYVERGASQ